MVAPNNRTELTSNAILTFVAACGIEWHSIAPGPPMQSGLVERLNGRLHIKALDL
ncbi:integrase core domain-containing protein [Aestuariivita sp.]|jgi:putative transposase|uniref:integrase core domain-containing protein n=1 Tax=Aestuariivita sp. TaxID=1872407 RepID=UPI00216EC435|nr:integrase core domain-containing protein [Aestuariivita sp.]MCE8007157.1 transposase [Aestuariivita sp.]